MIACQTVIEYCTIITRDEAEATAELRSLLHSRPRRGRLLSLTPPRRGDETWRHFRVRADSEMRRRRRKNEMQHVSFICVLLFFSFIQGQENIYYLSCDLNWLYNIRKGDEPFHTAASTAAEPFFCCFAGNKWLEVECQTTHTEHVCAHILH